MVGSRGWWGQGGGSQGLRGSKGSGIKGVVVVRGWWESRGSGGLGLRGGGSRGGWI